MGRGTIQRIAVREFPQEAIFIQRLHSTNGDSCRSTSIGHGAVQAVCSAQFFGEKLPALQRL